MVWAAGVIWLALDISGGVHTDAAGNNQTVTDVTGASVSQDQVKQLEQTIANL